MPNYRLYSTDVEQPAPDEHVVFDELSRTMQHITRTMAARYRHAYRPVHAKSHGLVVGTLKVAEGLPEELAQGLFAAPASYPVLLRFSTNPGDLLADTVSTPRAMAVKVLNVEGEKTPNHAGQTTQDFVCINGAVFSAAGPREFLEQIRTFDKHLETPEEVKHGISLAARGANTILKALHIPSSTLEGLGSPATHILGESFTTVAPVRYGRYIAKAGFAPASENLKELVDKHVDLGADYNALAELISHFFRTETAVWNVQVQLALAPEPPDTPDEKQAFAIEKADVLWPEKESPWQVVGQITAGPQNTYSDRRQVFVDERLSFSPWHALAAHRPLGGIMRSRLKAYEEAAKYRLQRNERERAEPASVDEIPA